MIDPNIPLLARYFERKDIERFIDRPAMMPQPTVARFAEWYAGLTPAAYAEAVKGAGR